MLNGSFFKEVSIVCILKEKCENIGGELLLLALFILLSLFIPFDLKLQKGHGHRSLIKGISLQGFTNFRRI